MGVRHPTQGITDIEHICLWFIPNTREGGYITSCLFMEICLQLVSSRSKTIWDHRFNGSWFAYCGFPLAPRLYETTDSMEADLPTVGLLSLQDYMRPQIQWKLISWMWCDVTDSVSWKLPFFTILLFNMKYISLFMKKEISYFCKWILNLKRPCIILICGTSD